MRDSTGTCQTTRHSSRSSVCPSSGCGSAAVTISVSDHDHHHTVHFPDTDLANLAIILAVIEPSPSGPPKMRCTVTKLIYLALSNVTAKCKQPPREQHVAKAHRAIQFRDLFVLAVYMMEKDSRTKFCTGPAIRTHTPAASLSPGIDPLVQQLPESTRKQRRLRRHRA